MSARCEVELDVFSGMPNPTWVLSGADADRFVERLAALPPAPATEPSGNLGYRGLIVECKQGADTRRVRVHKGVVHVSSGAATTHARDDRRDLERWLLETGRHHLKPEIYQIAKRETG